MKNSKRLFFISSYLKIFGVQKIELIEETENFIRGIAFYCKSDLEEKQEFIWKKKENEIPPRELISIIDRIIKDNLHTGDLINRKIEDIEFKEFDNNRKHILLDYLFDIEIKMIDDGEETDSYFVHY